MIGVDFSTDQLCDVVLVAGASPEECAEAEAAEGGAGTEMHAHRVILAACCPYFRAMFAGEMAEAKQQRIYIQVGVAESELNSLMLF